MEKVFNNNLCAMRESKGNIGFKFLFVRILLNRRLSVSKGKRDNHCASYPLKMHLIVRQLEKA